MASERVDVGEVPLIDPLLGQPRMVADPRISVAQAARILDNSPAQVYRYRSAGCRRSCATR
jgi:hypothetical protein